MKKKHLSFVVVFLMVFLLAACATDQIATQQRQIENAEWAAVHVGGHPVTVAPGRIAPNITLDSENKRVSGFSGCNRLIGKYRLNGNALQFGPLGSTRMACLNEDDLENRFNQAVAATQSWRFSRAGELELLDKEGVVVARFRSQGSK